MTWRTRKSLPRPPPSTPGCAAPGRTPRGLHIAIRRILEKLYELFARIKNALNGMGFKSAEDVFKPFPKGEMARRRERADVPREGTAQSIIPRPADIRESIADRFGPKLKTVTEGVYDLSKPVRDLQKELEARRLGTFPDAQDFYVKKRLFPGRRATEVEDFNREHLDPLVKALRDQRVNLDDAGQYLYAKHAEERNATIDRINPGLDGEGSGMSDADAHAILDRFAAQPNAGAFADLSRRAPPSAISSSTPTSAAGWKSPTSSGMARSVRALRPAQGLRGRTGRSPAGHRQGLHRSWPGGKARLRPQLTCRQSAGEPDRPGLPRDRPRRAQYLPAIHAQRAAQSRPEADDIAIFNKGEPRREIDKTPALSAPSIARRT
jgi:hypothetical protein